MEDGDQIGFTMAALADGKKVGVRSITLYPGAVLLYIPKDVMDDLKGTGCDDCYWWLSNEVTEAIATARVSDSGGSASDER